ncbi:MAG: formate/nitrite transporter family protein, partial [Clostridia bacterium]|nr:formate/nitrite transporter family protein [Clostridia bacterium]
MNSPKEIALNYVGIAQGKTNQSWSKTLILGIMAGMFISLGGMIAISASCHKTGVESAIIKGLVFPMGLILVVLCGSELFTGNCLLFAPFLSKDITAKGMLKNWLFTYLG